MRMHESSWEARAAAKREAIMAKIPQPWRLAPEDLERAAQQRDLTGSFINGLLDKQTVSITSMDSLPILESISSGKLSATEVTTAFCRTAAIAHQINNCLHEIFFDEAIDRAKYLDDYYAKNNKTVGPLHGLPISLKDQFHVKGVDTTMGYIGWIGSNLGISDPKQGHQVESQIVTELLSLGAVLFCKTSLPQTLLFGETKNNLIGQTLNPHNQNLSCGGSSGGEGALMALRGSSLGIGTDIGGSVRIPAGFCGVFSIKPTPERLSYRNVANTNPGQNTYRSTVGFLGTSLDALELLLKSLLSTKPWRCDPSVVPIPFRQEVIDSYLSRADESGRAKSTTQPLKIGIFWTDGVVGPHPPVVRGLRIVHDSLKSSGHKVVDWEPPSQATAKRVHEAFLMADGAHDIHQQLSLSGEPLIPDLKHPFQLRPPMGLLEYQDLTLQGLAYEHEYTDYWNSTADSDGQEVDVVIMPVAPHAAVIPGKYYHTAYTEAINLMNYSAVVIPVTQADEKIDVFDESYEPLGENDKLNWESYDPAIYHGAPVGVQVVTRKFEEEKALAIARIVHATIRSTNPL
ncbi:hypothetical protein BHE90_008999 [Fusarium euwallaceae]|uniref:amidase n=1 Tax=Fusarium euwallaceae TaxID=1147111 RepID=A0A430LLC8_9HYPO|nr:hypothetical protein BHE90_008999 [Fusarium euwallaceae]